MTPRTRLEITDRLGPDWHRLSVYLDVKAHERSQFPHGREPDAMLEWAERHRIGDTDLATALDAIGRKDLGDVLRTDVVPPPPAGPGKGGGRPRNRADEAGLRQLTADVQAFVADGDTDQAIDLLRNFLANRDAKLSDEVVLLAGRHNRARRDHRKGVLSADAFRAERGQIDAALLDLLPEIPRRVDPSLFPIAPAGPTASTTASVEASRSSAEAATGGAAAAPAPKAVVRPEAILGINNLRQIHWIERGVRASRSVCRVLTPGGVGTGFLIAPGVMMTNHHVVDDVSVAQETVVEFNYQQDAGGNFASTVRYSINATYFRTSPMDELDYTIVRIAPHPSKPSLDHWGWLPLNPNADPVPTEHVVIVQHPNGGLKQIVLTANYVTGTAGGRLLRYTTDTMPGSSGSPVFNDQWQVIAIHHAATTVPDGAGGQRHVNEGILMSAIKPHAGAFWPG